MKDRQIDPFFCREAPLVFAHRGGAGEMPESTAAAFEHALAAGADVLEIDLQLTADQEMVVWHGPELGNVFQRSTKKHTGHTSGQILLRGQSIHDLEWGQLQENAWVIAPGDVPPFREDPTRTLLSFDAFVSAIEQLEKRRGSRGTPWNIEIKAARGWKKTLPKLFEKLDQQTRQRKIAVVVACGCNVARVQAELAQPHRSGGQYAGNVPVLEQGYDWARRALGKPGTSLAGRLVQTSHALVTQRLVKDVRARGGSIHAFLTPSLLSGGIEHLPMADLRRRLFQLLDHGLDGIMTDYPARVGQLVREWRETAPRIGDA